MKRGMVAVLCVPLMLLAPLAAQEEQKGFQPALTQVPPWEKGQVTKIFEVKNRNPEVIAGLLGAFGARLDVSSALKAIAVTASPAVVEAVGEAINRFDMPEAPPPPLLPKKNIELTVYLMSGLAQAERDTVPKELEGVTKQLHTLFAYQGYRLMETMILRSRENRSADASGIGPAPTGSSGQPVYRVRYEATWVSKDSKGTVVRVDKLALSARVPVSAGGSNSFQYMEIGLNTDIDVAEGQKVVVGKTGMGGGDALIMVVTAKVVD